MRWCAPSALARSSFWSLLAVANMVAPASLATWTAALPMPEPAAWMRTLWPACSPPRLMSTCQAVPNAIWLAAASSKPTCDGSGFRLAIGTFTYSA